MTKSHGHTVQRKVIPTVNTAQYTANDAVGTTAKIQYITNEGAGGVITSIVVHDYASQTPGLTFWFFSQNPANTTVTNNAALDIADADLPFCLGTVSIVAADYKSAADNSVGTLVNVGFFYEALEGDLWVIVTADTTPTFTATTDIAFGFTFLMD